MLVLHKDHAGSPGQGRRAETGTSKGQSERLQTPKWGVAHPSQCDGVLLFPQPAYEPISWQEGSSDLWEPPWQATGRQPAEGKSGCSVPPSAQPAQPGLQPSCGLWVMSTAGQGRAGMHGKVPLLKSWLLSTDKDSQERAALLGVVRPNPTAQGQGLDLTARGWAAVDHQPHTSPTARPSLTHNIPQAIQVSLINPESCWESRIAPSSHNKVLQEQPKGWRTRSSWG